MDDETGNVYWEVQGTAPDRKLIVEWYNRPHFSNTGSATFEAILYETSNAIEFRYLDTDFGNAAYNYGATATSGLQQNTTTAVQYSFNQPVLFGGKGLRFEPAAYTPQVLNLSASDSDFAEVNVQIPNIDVDPLSMSATQATNTTTNQTLNVGNTGNAPLTWEIAETQPDRPARTGVVAAPEPVFDVPAAVTSEKDCAAFENYLGNEPDGWAQFCGQPAEAPASSPSNPTSTGYTLNLRTPDRNLKRFTLNNWPGQTVVGAQAANIYGMDFDSTASTLYALNASTNELGTLSTTTGVFTSIVACPAPAAGTWTGLSIDPTTNVFYASTASQPVHTQPDHLLADVDRSVQRRQRHHDRHRGQPGRRDVRARHLHQLDLHHQHLHRRGDPGRPHRLSANFAQGMDFDNEDGTLYIFLYMGTGVNHYGTVNLATGAVTALATTNPTGEFEGATQTLGLCIPNDYGWLSTTPITGTTAANSVTPVTVTFDSTSLANGTTPASCASAATIPTTAPATRPAWCRCR